MVATSFPCPYGSQHQETVTPRGSKQEVQPVERIVIAPLQVIDQQQEWLRRQAECGTHRLVKMKALPLLRERLWSGNFGIFHQNFREEAHQFCQLWLRQLPARNPQ